MKDSSKNIQIHCYKHNGKIHRIWEESIVIEEGNDYLVKQITDKKVGDATKKKIIQELLKVNTVGEDEILELAKEITGEV